MGSELEEISNCTSERNNVPGRNNGAIWSQNGVKRKAEISETLPTIINSVSENIINRW